MNLIALEIPEDPALLPGWLEEHLVSTDLAALVAELEAVHGQHGGEPVPSLDEALPVIVTPAGAGPEDPALATGCEPCCAARGCCWTYRSCSWPRGAALARQSGPGGRACAGRGTRLGQAESFAPGSASLRGHASPVTTRL